MEALLKEIEEVLPRVEWCRTEGPIDHGAKYFHGTAEGWTLTVASFDIETQGFPPGTRGYDGAAMRATVVIRLTRELAEKAFKLAEEKVTT